MTKARILANFISDNNEFADGTISVAEVSGAAPLASPSFTGNATFDTNTLYVDASTNGVGINTSAVDNPLEVLTTANDKGIILKDGDNDLVIIQRENEQFGRIRLMDSSSTRIDISARGDQGLKVHSTPATFNESGGDNDFRVESDGNTHMLFVDASENAVAIGSASTSTAARLRAAASAVASGDSIVLIDSANDANVAGNHLHIKSLRGDTTAYNLLTIENAIGQILNISGNGSVVFNEVGASRDIRVESNDIDDIFFIDGSDNRASFGTTSITGEVRLTVDGKGGALDGTSDTTRDKASIRVSSTDAASGGLGTGTSLFMGVEGADAAWIQAQHITDNGEKTLQLNPVGGAVVVNEASTGNADFRVESENLAAMLIVDASTDRVGIGAYPSSKFMISSTTNNDNTLHLSNTTGSANGGATNVMRVTAGGNAYWGNLNFQLHNMFVSPGAGNKSLAIYSGGAVVVNEDSNANTDFRVESDSNTHTMYLDASTDMVNFRTSGSAYLQKGGGMDAAINVNGSAYIGSAHYRVIANPNGKVFTLDTAGNGQQAFLHLQGSQYNGYRDVYYWATNYSGSWTVYSNTNASSGSMPTYTIGNNSSANPTITLAFSTGYSGGYVSVRMSNHWSVS
jgi:hypothetical protein